MYLTRCLYVSLFIAASVVPAPSEIFLQGPLSVWQTLTFTLIVPEEPESGSEFNPFLDYRLQIQFTGPSQQTYNVPGYFDGINPEQNQAQIWRARFTPDEAGRWQYRISFRKGKGVAVDLNAEPGNPYALDGASSQFTADPPDPNAPGFYKWGRLRYVGKHYLKFADGPYWIRGGTDSPENFLAYYGFVNTPPSHRYQEHEEDWEFGDPDWENGKGRGIIGALNYLSEQNVNSIYFLTMNIGGDGKDVWPWAGSPDPNGSPGNDNLRFDTVKLHQWETVFTHAQRKGIFLHFVLNEAEENNKRELDDGELGTERKLYYRELVARFGHHLALEWNLCEEYNLDFDFGADRIRAFADYIQAIDPYGHPITVHSAGDPVEKLRFTFGDERFSLTSIQLNQRPIHDITKAFRRETANSGRPLPVSLDEFTLDRGQRSYIPVNEAKGFRKEKIWPTYLSGGMIEFILEDLLDTESFKTPELENLWRYLWYARKFMEENLPFWEMEPVDNMTRGSGSIPLGVGDGNTILLEPQVYAKAGEVYAVYLPTGEPGGELDLSAAKGSFVQQWYNPRTGSFASEPQRVNGGQWLPLGSPPEEPEEDWVVLIKRP